MARDILKKMKIPETLGVRKTEWNPPEENLVDSELISRLVEHYIDGGDIKKLNLWMEDDFGFEVQSLQTIIKESRGNVIPQPLIDSLTSVLVRESDEPLFRGFTRTMYLTAVVQALYNGDYSDRFVIDIRDWPENGYDIGNNLNGRPDRPLTLNLYGNLRWCCLDARHVHFILNDNVRVCGSLADHCKFIFYEDVDWCGNSAKHSHFTFHKKVRNFGMYTEDCGFYLMPDAEMGTYYGNPSEGNLLRRLKENGEWEIIR